MSECELFCFPCLAVLACIGLCMGTSQSDSCCRGLRGCSCCPRLWGPSNRDLDRYISDIEREMDQERNRQRDLAGADPTPESGPAMPVPQAYNPADRPSTNGHRSASYDQEKRREHQSSRSEDRRRGENTGTTQPEQHEYPPVPYPARSAQEDGSSGGDGPSRMEALPQREDSERKASSRRRDDSTDKRTSQSEGKPREKRSKQLPPLPNVPVLYER